MLDKNSQDCWNKKETLHLNSMRRMLVFPTKHSPTLSIQPNYKNQSMWNTSGKGMDTGELSGFTSMMSAI